MKILMVNKFLYPNGGSETYIFGLGEYLASIGHKVEYFGMEHEGRIVGNSVGAYTSDMDFHGAKKLSYALKTIYSKEARKKIRLVLEDFSPDVVHLNNFNYQLTPSIILEIKKWRKQRGKQCKIVYTAHDYQLICPNHMMYSEKFGGICERCARGKFFNCFKGKCIHGSALKSLIGTMEGRYWKRKKVYKNLDAVICCSAFIKSKLDLNPVFSGKTVVLHNFIEKEQAVPAEKGGYVLYFGRLSKEKGIETLVSVCRELPHIKFVFAGTGDTSMLDGAENIEFAGFKSGEELKRLISGANISIYPSEWYENCPFSVMESQTLLTPVIGADIGGIPELIDDNSTGLLFESGNKEALKKAVSDLWNDIEKQKTFSQNCALKEFETLESYYAKLKDIYGVTE